MNDPMHSTYLFSRHLLRYSRMSVFVGRMLSITPPQKDEVLLRIILTTLN